MENKPVTLSTARLVMGALEERDREPLLRLIGDRQIGKTYMTPVFADRAEADAFFDRIRLLSRTGTRFVYGIFLNDQLIGLLNDCELTDIYAELGYFIDPAYWNRGYATEALSAAITALFGMGIRTVAAGYFEGNNASRRVMEKCGMQPVPGQTVVNYRGEERSCLHMEIRMPPERFSPSTGTDRCTAGMPDEERDDHDEISGY